MPFELSQGVGAVRAWLDIREGVARAATVDMALRAVELRVAEGLEPLLVEQLHGRLSARRQAGGGSVALRQFGFLTGDGVRWPAGDLDLTWASAADGSLRGGEFSAERLDLAVIADTAARLPLGAAVRTLLAETRPQGIASQVRAQWTGPLDALAQYQVSARLSEVSLAAKPAPGGNAIGRPGLRNVAIELDATEKGGQATLAMKDGEIDLPGVFAEPVLPLDEMRARLNWRIEPNTGKGPSVQVQVRDAQLANADAQGELTATWSTGPGEGLARGGRIPGQLELEGTLTRAVAARTARYLPLGLSEGTRLYVQRAVRGGTFTRASFRVNGDLWDFPMFVGRPGEFRVAIVASDLTLAYVPSIAAGEPGGSPAYESPWPPMTQVSGEIIVDRASFEFRNARARIQGVDLTALKGGIRNLADKSVLTLDTQARGPVADMLHFVNTTPVGDWIQGSLRETTASGNGELGLSLQLPLYDLGQTSVNGSLQLTGNDLHLRGDLPPLAAARGRIDFTGKSIAIVDAGARVLGGDAAIDGGTQADGSLRFNVQGRATAEALRGAPELGALARLAGALSGQANYRLVLGVAKGWPEIDLTSDLVGLASDLPPPLAKRAETPLARHVHTARTPGTSLDTLRVELGPVVRAPVARDHAGDAPRVLRGGIGIFAPAPTPASGVAATINLASLDVDAWEAAATRLFGSAMPEGTAGDSAAMPSQVGLTAQSLVVGGQRLTGVSAGLSQLDGQWRANVDADQLSGYLEYRPPRSGGSLPGRIYARLARLSLPRNDAEEVTRLLDRQPASVPALDIVIDDLELRGKRLGRMEVQAVNRLAPEREWDLTRLNVRLPEAQLNASGRWVASSAAPLAGSSQRRKAEFKFQLDIADSGALLQRLGSADAIRGGKGRLKGQVGWLGSPLQLDFPSMEGQFSVAIEQGQFLQTQSGAARLLGVLSLQSLARMLTLDFRDVFLEGFVFDSVTGEVTIAKGVASSRNLVMRGSRATVLLEGSADAERETQDLRVFVVPEINAGAASLAYALINPAIGLGTFIAQLFLREPLIQANTREFRITGTWADPQVESVVRQPGQAVPRIAPPASAAVEGENSE